MNSYPIYKHSGVEWLGDIPNDWGSIRLKYLGFLYGGLSGKSGKDFNDDGNPNNKPFIPFTNISDNTYISKDNLGKVNISEDDKQNRVKQFDLFFLMSSEDQEGIGKPSVLKEELGEVYLNTFCRGFRITDEQYDSLFINYLLSGHSYRELLSVEGRGFTRINLRSHKVSDFQIYYPPKDTQTQIVSFLDSKTQKIDKLIALTEQKIGLLKEQRTALINQCVTKGLNPNVEMKDSGVEWIGEIPIEWKCGKLNYFATRIGDGLHSTPKYVDASEYKFINGNNLKNGRIVIFTNTKCVDESQYYEHYIELNKRTLLLSINGTIGNISFYDDEKVILGKSACYIRCSNEINHQFVFYLIQSDSIQRYFMFESTGTTIFNLSLESVRKMPIPYTDLNEQQQIVEYLDGQTQKIDSTIEKESQRIELLKEYRQALISEVVTGKVDVRDEVVA
jgi:type I restriction enzyme, S subunit